MKTTKKYWILMDDADSFVYSETASTCWVQSLACAMEFRTRDEARTFLRKNSFISSIHPRKVTATLEIT